MNYGVFFVADKYKTERREKSSNTKKDRSHRVLLFFLYIVNQPFPQLKKSGVISGSFFME